MIGQNTAAKKVGRIGRILFSMPIVANAGRMSGVGARAMSDSEKRDHTRNSTIVMRVDTHAPKKEYWSRKYCAHVCRGGHNEPEIWA